MVFRKTGVLQGLGCGGCILQCRCGSHEVRLRMDLEFVTPILATIGFGRPVCLIGARDGIQSLRVNLRRLRPPSGFCSPLISPSAPHHPPSPESWPRLRPWVLLYPLARPAAQADALLPPCLPAPPNRQTLTSHHATGPRLHASRPPPRPVEARNSSKKTTTNPSTTGSNRRCPQTHPQAPTAPPVTTTATGTKPKGNPKTSSLAAQKWKSQRQLLQRARVKTPPTRKRSRASHGVFAAVLVRRSHSSSKPVLTEVYTRG